MRSLESSRSRRLAVVLAGIVLGQFVLYGPSLLGRKILLPLDLLAQPGVYLPRTPEIAALEPQNLYLSDPIYYFEPARRFAVSEWRSGRVPMWAPYEFAGVPVIWPKFSPFLLLASFTRSPMVLPWAAMAAALVAGLGAYIFFRRVLVLSFWPAAICAWCYPLTGFFVFWQGFPTSLAAYWFPWLLWAVDRTVSRASALAPLGLSVLTCVVLISGHIDVAGQVLLGTGLFALWRLWREHPKGWWPAGRAKKAAELIACWVLGFLLATPYLLPLAEYSSTGARMARRAAHIEERPPAGLEALPQAVLPDMYGAMERGSLRLAAQTQVESSAAAYAGVLATLVAAPLAWCSRRHRAAALCWSALCVFGLGWCLNVPGLVHLLRLPGLNMFSHNRLVFITAFGILALAAIGLEVLWEGALEWRAWMWLPLGTLAGLCAWCAFRTSQLPEPIATQIAAAVQQGQPVRWVQTADDVRRVQAWFVRSYAVSAAWCGLGVLAWICLRRWKTLKPAVFSAFGLLLASDLVWFGLGRSAQCDPAFYFPTLPVLTELAQSQPTRVMASGCLPANLPFLCGLRDIRGYDSVDPARMVELLVGAAEPASAKARYAETFWLTPRANLTPEGQLRLPGVLDMLGVQQVIFRGAPPPEAHPAFQGPDYYVLSNAQALPRVFVPERVEVVTNEGIRLQRLLSDEFSPRAQAFVETAVTCTGPNRGSARIIEENPTRIAVEARLDTPGLIVLADRWDRGWRAYLDGTRVPILKANHAIRGVVAPAGTHKLLFRYEPASFTLGLGLAGLAGCALLFWTFRTVISSPGKAKPHSGSGLPLVSGPSQISARPNA